MSRAPETPVDVWSWPERSQSLADTVFVSTSINNVEFEDDLEPKAYRDTRVAMEANRAAELEDLEKQYAEKYSDGDLNPGPVAHKTTALPAELHECWCNQKWYTRFP